MFLQFGTADRAEGSSNKRVLFFYTKQIVGEETGSKSRVQSGILLTN